MKRIFFLFLFTYVGFAYSQTSIGVENDLKGLMTTGGNVSNTVMSAFNNSAIKGKRYAFDTWTPGSVVSVNGTVYASKYGFNLDKIDHDLYAIDSNYKNVFLLDKSKVRRFYAGPISFVNSASLKGASFGYFYQVLAEDSAKYSLYKLTTTKFVKANPNDIMNARTGNLSNEYADEVKYFISLNNGELRKISLNENNIRKALKEKDGVVDSFFNAHSTRDVDEAFLVELIESLNH